MKRYETFVVLNSDISEDERRPVTERISSQISGQNGMLIRVDEWGTRRLAYEIKKKSRGYYIRFEFCGAGPLVNEIERFCRIDDRVLKYMTVLIDENADIEKIKQEMAEAKEESKPQNSETVNPSDPMEKIADAAPASEAPETHSGTDLKNDLSQPEMDEPLTEGKEEEPHE
jgi:small subunit ribosomal protein S6